MDKQKEIDTLREFGDSLDNENDSLLSEFAECYELKAQYEDRLGKIGRALIPNRNSYVQIILGMLLLPVAVITLTVGICVIIKGNGVGMLVVALPITLLSLWCIFNGKKYTVKNKVQLEREQAELSSQYNNIIQRFEYLDNRILDSYNNSTKALPPKYASFSYIRMFIELIETNVAYSIPDAIAYHENKLHQQEMEQTQRDILREQEATTLATSVSAIANVAHTVRHWNR